MNTEKKKSSVPEKDNKTIISERERYKGKLDKAENKRRGNISKDRSKKAGHEAVSDQKAHEYH